MTLRSHLLFFPLFLFLWACADDPAASDTPEFVRFRFLAADQPDLLSQDIEAEIGASQPDHPGTIHLDLPYGTDRESLVARFELSEGAEAYVGDLLQVSGESANDFRTPIRYRLQGEGYAPLEWVVHVGFTEEDKEGNPAPRPSFLSFGFEPEHNPELQRAYPGDLSKDAVDVYVAFPVPTTTFKASFNVAEGVEVWVDEQLQISGETLQDFDAPVVYTLKSPEGREETITVRASFLDRLPETVPVLYIDTDSGDFVEEKRVYLDGALRIDGQGSFADQDLRMEIRGRGNSTWTFPKKPFRIKLDKRQSVLGLPPAKNWVLLANWLDGTLMCNAIAMKAGRLLEIPYTHHIIPVEVIFNGEPLGQYMLTEHKEVAAHRIDIGDDGILLEFDVYFDEPFQFISQFYELPVMIQYPKLDKLDDVDEANLIAQDIQNAFEDFEAMVVASDFPENGYREAFDLDDLARYMIVYYLTANEEINHPKSTYMYRKAGEPFRMGPIWDFDWAYGYNPQDDMPFIHPERPLFWPSSSPAKGRAFFSRFLEDDTYRAILSATWVDFRNNHLSELLDFIDEYADLTRGAYDRDQALWRRGSGDIDEELARILPWMDARVAFLDSLIGPK